MKSKIFILIILFSSVLLKGQNDLTATITHPTFNHDCLDGVIDLHINGGNAPYDVRWFRLLGPNDIKWFQQGNTGIQGNNDGEDLVNYPPGRYLVEVEDALCGMAEKVFTLICECSDDCMVEASEIMHASCSQNGLINIDVSCTESGHPPFTFQWMDGPTTQNRKDLNPGIYCVTVTDVDGCEYDNCFQVLGNNNLNIQLVNKDNASLCEGIGGCDGSIDIEVVSGNGGYTYNWSNGSTVQDQNNLCKGTYTVTVTDNSGCQKIKSFDICCCSDLDPSGPIPGDCYVQGNAQPITISETIEPLPQGYIQTVVRGGTYDYSCRWEDSQGNIISYNCWGINDITQPGEYCIFVDDGCEEIQECYNIVDCTNRNITASETIVHTCDELEVGSISLAINGGVAPYMVTWSNGQIGSSINNLGPGQYCATIEDADKCEAGPFCFNINSNPPENEETSTAPCQTTIYCNGTPYTEPTNYIVTLNCNILELYCPVTEETLIYDLGYVSIYEQNCDVYGLCQDGNSVLLEQGYSVAGPFASSDGSCESGYSCVDWACYLPQSDILIYDDDVPRYCANLEYVYDKTNCGHCCCRVNIYCGDSYMGYDCTSEYQLCQYAISNQDDEGNNLEDRKISFESPKIISGKKELFEYFSNKISNPHKSKKTNTTIYPNPTDGWITIDFIDRETESQEYNIYVYDVNGKKLSDIYDDIIFSDKSIEFNLSNEPDGMYIILIADGDNITLSTHKVIKSSSK